ncbi:hypothetical protein [Nodularia sp. NIES-3585]|uniref:hypothetical protein n=1 Tax=Nodularia sp. NIES-3585 TaxID=1973477 RepID=UPI0015963D72|nr:hypothetical protein [Nodularia sp. NIES-3585]
MISYIVSSIGYFCVYVDALWAAYLRLASGDREAQPNGILSNRTLGDVTKSRL